MRLLLCAALAKTLVSILLLDSSCLFVLALHVMWQKLILFPLSDFERTFSSSNFFKKKCFSKVLHCFNWHTVMAGVVHAVTWSTQKEKDREGGFVWVVSVVTVLPWNVWQIDDFLYISLPRGELWCATALSPKSRKILQCWYLFSFKCEIAIQFW